MNRQLRRLPLLPNVTDLYLNNWYNGPGSTRLEEAIISNGILIQPDTSGVRAIVGVPPLEPQRTIHLENVMAIEADMGCIDLGLFTERDLDSINTLDIFATQWDTQIYHVGGRIRNLVRPLFNESSINDVGYLFTNGFDNGTRAVWADYLGTNAQVVGWHLPGNLSLFDFISTEPTVEMAILKNCTQDVYSALGLTPLPRFPGDVIGYIPGSACSTLAVQGSFTLSTGVPLAGLSRFLCAASTQVNLVSANISSSNDSALTLDFVRHDAELYYTIASWWHVQQDGNDRIFNDYEPYERYTLYPSPGSGRQNHYLPTPGRFLKGRPAGPGSAGGIISSLSDYLVSYPSENTVDMESVVLTDLDDDEAFINFNATMIPTWAGGMAAAFLREGIAYNGWVALDHWNKGGLRVSSGGEKPAVCYNLRYGVALLPLLAAAVITLLWGVVVLARSTFKGRDIVLASYGGLSPLRAKLVPAWAAKSAVLIWQGVPEPHLENRAARKYVLVSDTEIDEKAASYLGRHDAPLVDFVELEH
ncbi:hypothetical protein B0H13DRAFT_2039045 [Mycena leptocephala]|nr:hypothetical protein B0H13DRAFT_2039045 [Mycena leptocephala]